MFHLNQYYKNMNASEILKHHEVKKTLARIAIINALQTQKYPLSENDIKEFMSDMYDRVTFYRNIQTLTSAGIIHKIVADNTTIRYALNCCEMGHKHLIDHAHFFCETCHQVFCLEQVKIPMYNLPIGFTSSNCDIIIKGVCNKCNSH